MRLLLIAVVTSSCGALLLAACGDGDRVARKETVSSTALVGEATAGEVVYDGTCVACHGPDAMGIPGLGKDWTTSEFIENNSDADLIAFVKQGRSATDPDNTTGVDMPAMGGNNALTEQDLADVIAYARSLQK